MKVKDIIIALLDVDINKEVSIEYPTADGQIVGNYSRYEEAKQFEIHEYMHGVVIGISNED